MPVDYQPRTIALIAELVHTPVDPDPRPLQKVHGQLFEGPSPPYAGFQVVPGGAVLSNPVAQQGAVSQVAFLADRLQFREERTALTPDAFAQRVRRVLEVAAPARGLGVLSAAQVIVRSLINPRQWQDAREFLREAVLGLDSDGLEAFGRDPGLYGVRFSFPGESESAQPIDLRIESFQADPRSLFLELRAAHGPIRLDTGLDALEEHVHSTYRFLVDRALPFVARYDARGPQ